MRQTRRRDRRSLGQELFATRQVYLRNGPASQYVTLSRGLQVAVAAGLAVTLLWLGVASYAAVATHLQTVEQARKLARLEGIAKALRASVEQAQDNQRLDRSAAPDPHLMTELAEVRLGRERAMMLANAAAGEADALRSEVALANQCIRELELALASTKLGEPSLTNLVTSSTDGPRIADGGFEEMACPAH